jgi:hypothetical protein
MLEGVVVAVGWIAARRRAWNAATAARVFVSSLVVASVVIASFVAIGVHGGWAVKRADRDAEAAALATVADPDARVMSIDASGTKYASGHGGVVSPNDPIDTIRQVADAYRIEWLIVERDSLVAALEPVLRGTDRPSWIGSPILTIPAADGGPPRAAVYPVCLSPSDPRCRVVATSATAVTR